jgi:uncharacterized membrane protein
LAVQPQKFRISAMIRTDLSVKRRNGGFRMIKIEWVQWTLYFFFYAFAGWAWESMYVSVLSRHWVNRGFLHGPFIPIYGFGALLILVMTYFVRYHAAAVFFVGMIGATILEYGTGMLLDRWFHIRLWDYSRAVWNFRGYVSVVSSIFWGVLAVVLVIWIHPLFSSVIHTWPAWVSVSVCLLLLTLEGADFISRGIAAASQP